jgi:two-component system, chemotaxis family, protein-glutamate methylesterase/glutaminase
MLKTRVLIVDDSVVIRRLVSDALADEPTCEVVGTAANGKIALTKIPQVNPDIVTLDIEMPEMDGLETIAAIRKIYPLLPVIMFSTLTERGAEATLKALSLGASDYVTKPSATSIGGALKQVKDELIPRIKGLTQKQSGVADRATSARPLAPWPPSSVRAGRPPPCVEIVAIGSSTGGPNALAAVISKLPADFPVPIVITQHMPPLFTRLLAERLNAASQIRVHEAKGGEVLEPGHVFIARGDFHMSVRREGTRPVLALHQAPPENSCRPAVDVMFRSVVETYGGHVLAVVLTGMGQDGLRGCECVREAGGQIVVQDEATSVVWGMPGFVARAGLADAVVPLGGIDLEILQRARAGARPRPALRASAAASKGPHGH